VPSLQPPVLGRSYIVTLLHFLWNDTGIKNTNRRVDKSISTWQGRTKAHRYTALHFGKDPRDITWLLINKRAQTKGLPNFEPSRALYLSLPLKFNFSAKTFHLWGLHRLTIDRVADVNLTTKKSLSFTKIFDNLRQSQFTAAFLLFNMYSTARRSVLFRHKIASRN
jgi:hypothetical protein